MNDTEEEQIESIKKWWAENGRAIIIGVIIGAGGIFGWRFWEGHQQGQAQVASLAYEALVSEFNKGDAEQVDTLTESLKDEHASTPYAALASLLNAKLAVDNSELDKAASALRWAVENTPEEGVRSIARLRLSRVLSAQDNHDDALSVLNNSFPDAYTALVEELKGDVLVAQGNPSLAREAYSRAMLTDQSQGSTALLKMKLDDLSTVADES